MKKSILNIGNILNKTEQKTISGGTPITHEGDPCHVIEGERVPSGCPCSGNFDCVSGTCYSPGSGAIDVCY
ncbi:hypothetical protein [Tenacibaculum discolor]|uniref:hypothetical protein n=1 Tax=Tenacibaculum discolor TaxID=361581 RepID=UPI003F7B2FDC